jgi:hypothetical protein
MFDVVMQFRVDTDDETVAVTVMNTLAIVARDSSIDPNRPKGIPVVKLRAAQARRLSSEEAKDPKDLTAELVRGITSAFSKSIGDDTEGWKGGTA